MKALLREQAVNLRLSDELSYGEIQKRLKVSKSTLSYWLRDLPLSKGKILELRRSGWNKGEASREIFRATMREKQLCREDATYQRYLEKFSNPSESIDFVAGLMLYASEGNKKDRYRIALANTDLSIIKFFVGWLHKYLYVEKSEMKIELHLYGNMDILSEEQYWYQSLCFERSQLYKTQIKELKKSSFSYKDSLRHGTCSIMVSGAERKREIMMAIKAYLDSRA